MSTPNPERLVSLGEGTARADALLAYLERQGGRAGETYSPDALEALHDRHEARVLRLVVDVAAGSVPDRQFRADVLFGRLLPRLLQRVHRLGLLLGRDYGLEPDYGRRW